MEQKTTFCGQTADVSQSKCFPCEYDYAMYLNTALSEEANDMPHYNPTWKIRKPETKIKA